MVFFGQDILGLGKLIEFGDDVTFGDLNRVLRIGLDTRLTGRQLW